MKFSKNLGLLIFSKPRCFSFPYPNDSGTKYRRGFGTFGSKAAPVLRTAAVGVKERMRRESSRRHETGRSKENLLRSAKPGKGKKDNLSG